jgi:hypothetical protein
MINYYDSQIQRDEWDAPWSTACASTRLCAACGSRTVAPNLPPRHHMAILHTICLSTNAVTALGREFKPRLEHVNARVTQWSEWGSYERVLFLLFCKREDYDGALLKVL